MPGASRASPAARVRIAARSSSGAVSLSRNPLAPAPQRAVDVVVEVEGGQDEDPGCGSVRVGGDGAGGLDAVEDRHPDVHQDDVGVVLADHGDGLRAVRGLAQYLHVGRRADHDHEAAAYQCLVAASDDGGGQDRAGHEADDDQRGPAGGDGGDGVQGHGDIGDSPSSCPQVQRRQRGEQDERQRGAGEPPPERRGHGGHGVRHPAAGVPCGSRCPGRPVRYEKSEGNGYQRDRDHVYGHQPGFGEAVGGQAAEQGSPSGRIDSAQHISIGTGTLPARAGCSLPRATRLCRSGSRMEGPARAALLPGRAPRAGAAQRLVLPAGRAGEDDRGRRTRLPDQQFR